MLTPHQVDLHTIHTQQFLHMLLTVYLYLTEQSPIGHSADTKVICRQRPYPSLQHPCYWSQKTPRRAASFVLAVCWKLRGSNRQDFVFIRHPGIARGAFELRMDNVWCCKLFLLFEIVSKTDAGFERHACAFLSVMEEYTGCRKPGIYEGCRKPGIYEIHVTYATYLIYVKLRPYPDNLSCHACSTAWLSECESSIIYERKLQSQVLYVVPVTSILGRREPFRTACARKRGTFLGHHVTQRRMLLTAADGGTSTHGP